MMKHIEPVSRFLRRVRRSRGLFFLLLAMAGCVTVTQPDRPKPIYQTRITDAAHSAQPRSTPATAPVVSVSNLKAATEPCAVRMHDLIGPLLEYYVLHRQLPARLEALRTLGDLDGDLSFTCPVSGEPYVYETQPLLDPQGRQLILHDATAVHGGLRWAIVDESKPGQARVMTVVPLDAGQFNAFVPQK